MNKLTKEEKQILELYHKFFEENWYALLSFAESIGVELDPAKAEAASDSLSEKISKA